MSDVGGQAQAALDAGTDPPVDAGSGDEVVEDSGAPLASAPDPGLCLATANPPHRLSETGCFEGVPPRPTKALLSYGVVSPLWSDGADKRRYVAVPIGEAFDVDEEGDLEPPPGSVFIKGFWMQGAPIETRFLVRLSDGTWSAYTYAWDAQQQDAVLLDGEHGKRLDSGWQIPSRRECFDCHTDAAGVSLGLELAQLAGEHDYELRDVRANQLEVWRRIGWLRGDVVEAEPPLAALDDTDAAVDVRARSYLHSNCSMCHRPGAGLFSQLDMRRGVDMADTGMCREAPLTADPIAEGGQIIALGAPERSVLSYRMRSKRADWRMPPLGSLKLDAPAADLLDAWIEQGAGCPEEP